jgi:TIR domain
VTGGPLPGLAVHVVWHPAAPEAAADYADALFAHLFEDPADLTSHGLRIPIWHWRSRDPPRLPVDEAERCAVVVLVDEELVSAPRWREWLAESASSLRPQDRLIPVALFEKAVRIGSEHNFIRLFDLPDEIRVNVLLNRVSHALCRMLDGEEGRPVTVFISHAKADGLEIAQAVRRFLHEDSGVEDFFDAFNIREGDRWRKALEHAASRQLLLAIRTDAYATREWCQYEVLQAKLNRMPVVVLDAFGSREARGFPYLGNAPSLRWRPTPSRLDFEQLLTALMREALRAVTFPLRVREVCALRGLPEPDSVLAAPPELLTVLGARKDGGGVLVYPDPPLGTDELGVIRELLPGIAVHTPTTLMSA